jgi:hypothetical protein
MKFTLVFVVLLCALALGAARADAAPPGMQCTWKYRSLPVYINAYGADLWPGFCTHVLRGSPAVARFYGRPLGSTRCLFKASAKTHLAVYLRIVSPQREALAAACDGMAAFLRSYGAWWVRVS